jgi:hypothetical protein
MDFMDALKAGGASATMIVIAGVLIKVVQTFCGHRLRSECCGKEGTVGVSIETIEQKPVVQPEIIVVKSPRSSLEPSA